MDKRPYYAALEACDAAWQAKQVPDLQALEHMLSSMLATQLLKATEQATGSDARSRSVRTQE